MYGKSMWFDLTPAARGARLAGALSTDEMFRDSYDWFLAHRRTLSVPGASAHRSAAKQGVLRLAKRMLR